MAVRRTLREDRASGYMRAEWATLADDGRLTIAGQSLAREDVVSEYEWAFTIPADQVATVLAAVGGSPADDVLAALAAYCRIHHPPDFTGLFEHHHIEYEFCSRFGD